jgi:hypothetical protein
MVAKYWVGGSDEWNTTAGSKWASASGGTTYLGIPTTSDTVFFTNLSGINTVTIGTGAVCSTLTMTGFPGTLAFGSGVSANSITTSGNTTFFTGDITYSVTGTPLIKSNYSGATIRSIIAGSVSEAQSISFEITAGTGTVSPSGNIRSLVFSGGTTTLSGTNAFTLYGDLTVIAGMTISISSTSVRTFAGSGTQKITVPSPLNLDFPITFSGTGTYQLQANLAVGTSNTRAITHTSGTIDLQSYTLTHFGTYTSSSSVSSRGFTGTGVYNIIRTGTATYWDCAVATGFTRSGTASVQFTGVNTSASTLTVSHGTTTGAEANAMSFFFGSAPTVNLANTNKIADLGVLPSSSITLFGGATGRTIYGGFFGGVSTTSSANPFGVLTFASTSATARNINISSSSALTFTGVGGSWQLSGTSSAPTVTLTNGTFSTNGNSLTVTTFDFTAAGTRTLNINTTLTISSGGIFKGISTGTTLNNTGTISGSGYTVDVPNLNIGNVTTTGNITIGASASSYTINNLTAPSGGGANIYLYRGSTLNIAGNLSIDGSTGSTNTLQSDVSGTRANISKSSGTIITNNLNIVDSNATGGATWRAPTNYGNIDGGNNLGWNFSAISAGGGGNFLMFF